MRNETDSVASLLSLASAPRRPHERRKDQVEDEDEDRMDDLGEERSSSE